MADENKKTNVVAGAHPDTEPEFVEALLQAYRKLELAEQLGALLESAAAWTGASCGFALGAGSERRVFLRLAATLSEDDPRFGTVSAVEPERLKSWLPDGSAVFAGFGPFDAVVGSWPGKAPEHCGAFPVLDSRERWVGVLLMCFDNPPAAESIDRVERLLKMSRQAVDNALQVHSMRELVIKDDTASCFNRRHFEEFLPEELSRASRFRSPVSLIFLDMDNLKQVNSTHGHSMGSQTLYEVSLRVRSRIRKFDKLFRFGGDEFCIVLPETAWHGALEVAERVRDVIAGKPFLTRELGPQGVQMTASLGLAAFPLHARTQHDLIHQADLAMRQVKKGGKNAIGISEIVGGDDGS